MVDRLQELGTSSDGESKRFTPAESAPTWGSPLRWGYQGGYHHSALIAMRTS